MPITAAASQIFLFSTGCAGAKMPLCHNCSMLRFGLEPSRDSSANFLHTVNSAHLKTAPWLRPQPATPIEHPASVFCLLPSVLRRLLSLRRSLFDILLYLRSKARHRRAVSLFQNGKSAKIHKNSLTKLALFVLGGGICKGLL